MVVCTQQANKQIYSHSLRRSFNHRMNMVLVCAERATSQHVMRKTSKYVVRTLVMPRRIDTARCAFLVNFCRLFE